MNDEALAIADIGEVREELHVLNELFTSLAPTLDAEGEDSSRSFREIDLLPLDALVFG
jgi:hypothetical protein